MRIWINAGEASGDLHGALLAEKLRERAPDVDLVGMAGPAMREAGVKPLFRVEALSVMGLTEVFGHLPKILGLLRGIKRELRVQRPDALVCIDAQAFNFRVISMARVSGYSGLLLHQPQALGLASGPRQIHPGQRTPDALHSAL